MLLVVSRQRRYARIGTRCHFMDILSIPVEGKSILIVLSLGPPFRHCTRSFISYCYLLPLAFYVSVSNKKNTVQYLSFINFMAK